MKTPVWEPSAGALVAWLGLNRQATPIDLWTIRLIGGTVLRYSGGDIPVTVNGVTWSLGPGLQRTRLRQTIGVSVDTMTMTLKADASVLVGAVPLLQALAAGLFDGATVQVDRAFLDDAQACQGVMPGFFGRVGQSKVGRSGMATVEVRSHSELLNVMVPGDVYQPGCRNSLFDADCGLAAASYTVSGVVASIDGTRRVLTSSSAAVVAKPTAWADLGLLAFTSGLNAGVSRSVRTHVLAAGVATITAVAPFKLAIAAGDTFTLRAGCNKVYGGDCTVKFANQARFRGEPFIPAPETIL